MAVSSVCVYCASSQQARPEFLAAARTLGGAFAARGWTTVYGGGRVGLMGALADGALAGRGQVRGVIPEFMRALEWAHDGVSFLETTPDMHTRKKRMVACADAIVALPGGCGTLEELLEAITWKRLGIHGKPIVIANLAGFYDALLAQLAMCIDERMMRAEHGAMWTAVRHVEDVIPALLSAPAWSSDAVKFAQV
jgi:hypothetical protein